MTERVVSIQVGPFEFPISGAFSVTRQGQGTSFTTPDESRRYTVAYFRNVASLSLPSKTEQVAKLEQVLKGNWEYFAGQENGNIIEAFRRTETGSGVVIFSMGTEFVVRGERQYYVQFVATDGPQFASMFVEGFGPALPALRELEPLVATVRVKNGG